MQAVPGLVDQPGDRGQGHLLRQGQHQCLEQWREAGELAGTVRLNLDNPPFEQLHPRRLTSRQLGKITGCATAWCGRHGPDATIQHLAPQTGCRRQVKADPHHLFCRVEINASSRLRLHHVGHYSAYPTHSDCKEVPNSRFGCVLRRRISPIRSIAAGSADAATWRACARVCDLNELRIG